MKTPPPVVETEPGGPVDFARRLLQAWNRFWFSPADPTTLGLIRLCTGIVTFYVILVYTFELQNLFGREAWLNLDTVTVLRKTYPVLLKPDTFEPPVPRAPAEPPADEPPEVKQFRKDWGGLHPDEAYAKGTPAWSVWYHVSEQPWMGVVHALVLVSVFCFAIGFCTRVTAVLTWIGVVSYIQRAATTNFGMDQMMILAIIYLAIGPSGAAVSVDRLIARWWARRQARRRGMPPPSDEPPQPRVTANFAIRMMQVHFCVIYLASGLSKLQGATWWGGTAVWGVMANPGFNPVHVPLYYEFLLFLSRHRWLWEAFVTGGTIFTVALEISFPYLVWNPKLRWFMICCGVLLHTGIALMMGLVGFGLFMMCLLLSFVPSEVTRGLIDQVVSGARRQLESLGLRPAAGAVQAARAA